MKNKIIVAICIFVVVVLLFPIPLRLKDGGTVEYKAIIYKVSDVHSLATLEEIENGKEYNEGIIVEILGIEVFNNVE